MGTMAIEAGFHRGGVGVGQCQPSLDGRVAGEAEILRLLAQQVLPAAVVGGVADAALTLGWKAVILFFAFGGLCSFMADRAQLAATPGMKNIGIGGSVGLVAPLATAFAQGFMGRGRFLQFPGRGMAGHTLLARIIRCERG